MLGSHHLQRPASFPIDFICRKLAKRLQMGTTWLLGHCKNSSKFKIQWSVPLGSESLKDSQKVRITYTPYIICNHAESNIVKELNLQPILQVTEISGYFLKRYAIYRSSYFILFYKMVHNICHFNRNCATDFSTTKLQKWFVQNCK